MTPTDKSEIMQRCSSYNICYSLVVNVLALCQSAYLISSARSEVIFGFLHLCHQASFAVIPQTLYEVRVTIHTVWISHACLTSDNVNPETCSVQRVQHITTLWSNHLFIMPPQVQYDSQNTTDMLWEFPLILLEANWNSQFIHINQSLLYQIKGLTLMFIDQ